MRFTQLRVCLAHKEVFLSTKIQFLAPLAMQASSPQSIGLHLRKVVSCVQPVLIAILDQYRQPHVLWANIALLELPFVHLVSPGIFRLNLAQNHPTAACLVLWVHMRPRQAFPVALSARLANSLIKLHRWSAKSALSGFTPVQKAHHLLTIACHVLLVPIGRKAFAPFVLLERSTPSSEHWIPAHACRVVQDFIAALDPVLVFLAPQGQFLRFLDLQHAYFAPLEHTHFQQTLSACFVPLTRFLSVFLHLVSPLARVVMRTHFPWRDLLVALFWSVVLEARS